MLSIKHLSIAIAAVGAISAMTSIATAQSYPFRPITIIVPFPAGGGSA
jgi:tripartite-type tricarboxylate transporter receptor subunit TctC